MEKELKKREQEYIKAKRTVLQALANEDILRDNFHDGDFLQKMRVSVGRQKISTFNRDVNKARTKGERLEKELSRQRALLFDNFTRENIPLKSISLVKEALEGLKRICQSQSQQEYNENKYTKSPYTQSIDETLSSWTPSSRQKLKDEFETYGDIVSLLKQGEREFEGKILNIPTFGPKYYKKLLDLLKSKGDY